LDYGGQRYKQKQYGFVLLINFSLNECRAATAYIVAPLYAAERLPS
jgi:hypothetical protein